MTLSVIRYDRVEVGDFFEEDSGVIPRVWKVTRMRYDGVCCALWAICISVSDRRRLGETNLSLSSDRMVTLLNRVVSR